MIPGRTVIQIRTHAQKFLAKLQKVGALARWCLGPSHERSS